jgi:4-diphosphocytidyl-2C-methyl-D-erythritol kinase
MPDLNLIPQHRTSEQIAVSICRRMNERDDMAAKAKASAQGFKGMIDKIDEDLEQLREEFGLVARMSGSGSACFALLPAGMDAAAIGQTVRAAWGPTSFVVEAKLR